MWLYQSNASTVLSLRYDSIFGYRWTQHHGCGVKWTILICRCGRGSPYAAFTFVSFTATWRKPPWMIWDVIRTLVNCFDVSWVLRVALWIRDAPWCVCSYSIANVTGYSVCLSVCDMLAAFLNNWMFPQLFLYQIISVGARQWCN